MIATTIVSVPDQAQTIFNVPLAATVPAGTFELVMEVFTPSGQEAGNAFLHRLQRGGADRPELCQLCELWEPHSDQYRGPGPP